MLKDDMVIEYYAVFDNNNGYFNGNVNFKEAKQELLDRRADARESGDDEDNIFLVAVLDV